MPQIASLASLVTVTRASAATYYDANGVMQSAAVDTPRWDYDPDGGDFRGLLREGESTNLVLQSGDVTSGPWTLSNIASTAVDVGAAPDGGDMITLVALAGSGDHAARQSVSGLVYGADEYAVSAFVRTDQHRFAKLWGFGNGSAGVAFDLQSMTAQVNGSWISASIKRVGPNLARIAGVLAPDQTTTLFVGLAVDIGGNAGDFSGGEQLSVWGVQMEKRVGPTSYIATTASAVTREKDLVTIPIDPWFEDQEGVFAIDFTKPFYGSTYDLVFQLGQGNDLFQLRSSGASLDFVAGDGGIETSVSPGTAPAPMVRQKIACAFDAASIAVAKAGGPVQTQAAATGAVPAVTDRNLYLGSAHNGGSAMDGWIHSVRHYPRRLADGDLQEVSQ